MPNQGRRLAAIMFTDISGFSRQMGADESTTLRLLDVHNNIMTDVVGKYDGRVIKTIGDSFMVEFDSAVRAVKCAVEAQEHFLNYNKGMTRDSEKIFIKIGIHLGDVVVRGNDILGDGVNIASRLEGLAEPGGICISQDVYNQVKNKMEIKAIRLGPAELKNIRDQVEIYKVLIESIAGVEEAQVKITPTVSPLRKLFLKRQYVYGLVVLAGVALQIFVLPNIFRPKVEAGLGNFPGTLLQGSEDEEEQKDVLSKENGGENDMYRTMMSLMRDMKKTDELITLARSYVQMNPNNTSALLTLGFALESDKRYEEAVKTYEKALNLDPSNVEVHVASARLYLMVKKIDESKKHLETALALDPKRKELAKMCWKLGNAFAEKQRYQEGMALLQKATQMMGK